MDFKEATDELLRAITHAELAKRLGCSVASVRQARLDPDANAHRSPPPGWEPVVKQLAAEMRDHFSGLHESLDP